ncbi:right-handed parallel beta-helix repeat-containing protein [Chitinophaga ginsengisegetis]|uniref:parallel beta-helix domain-containing protein n=1 Tax=Chitinophaga ginsengisegetis TaxID=393003 RepID=UPI000DBA79A9|nr:parallel beta-helix domain-containing protein [Chitinophaga ginsengisegetis]MDR6568320.1 parallel beta-helix repeat protein [Chitinophaga ginsengisegetis]MDR6648449.1 parallel beta-helix repeat protein [Chitinophaga ginsengisegetis]MDR6654401.1 parallel beta-helix repeat protein [Chitinophaga ginsengisegetis]
MKRYPICLLLIALLAACQGPDVQEKSGYKTRLQFGPGEETKIAEAFLSLKDSSSITLKEGTYKFDNLSIAQVNHILIQGAGPDKTIFDFSAQSQGGEGIRVTDVKGFTIDGLTLRDSKGDLIKINKSERVVVTNVHAIWSVSDSTSGGYAIYPVMCKDVLVENCYAQGASDAGIYVGQTDSAIVRKCKAFKNVAGCEIENTSHAQVYDNEFWGNTAGFLIFDLPDLSKRGGFVKAYNNYMHDNNEKNFAKSGSFGSTWGVGNAAPGSGVVILAASDIELYNNRIINNNSSAISVVSGFFIDEKAGAKINDHYFPIPRNVHIHDNIMEVGAAFPPAVYEHHTGKILVGIEQKLNADDPARKNARLPFITYDGITTNILTKGTAVNPDSLCIRQTGPNLFVNVDAMNMTSKNWKPSTDVTPYVCK